MSTDVEVTWKGYLHPEDGRICYPTPDAGWSERLEWKGPGQAPKPGQRVFSSRFSHHDWDRRTWPCKRDHPEQPDPLPMVAVTPPPHAGGKLVHLLLPGYAPGRDKGKPRPNRHVAMCNAIGVSTQHWNITTEKDEPTGREHWPVSVAVHELAHGGYLRWCATCVGRAAEHADVLSQVVRLVLEQDLTTREHQ